MRSWLTLVLVACGSPPPRLTSTEAGLGRDDLITQRMCSILVDHVFDVVQENIPLDPRRHSGHGLDSISLRDNIERDRERLKRPDALGRCAARYRVWNYDCAMKTSDTVKIKDCLPAFEWSKSPP